MNSRALYASMSLACNQNVEFAGQNKLHHIGDVCTTTSRYTRVINIQRATVVRTWSLKTPAVTQTEREPAWASREAGVRHCSTLAFARVPSWKGSGCDGAVSSTIVGGPSR